MKGGGSMNQEDTNVFLNTNTHIAIAFDDDYAYCRNENLAWYQADPDRCTRIEKKKFLEMDEHQLLAEICRGLDVVGIARVTGYFSMVSGWNKGKLGELRDRSRNDMGFSPPTSSPS